MAVRTSASADRTPDRALAVQKRGHHRRSGNAYADAGELQALKIVASRHAEMPENDRGREDHGEGAGEAGKKPDEHERRHRIDARHRRGERGAPGKGDDHHRALAAGSPAAGRRDGAGEITQIVGGSDQPGLACRQTEFRHHGWQDRRIDEASDAHCGGNREKTAEGQSERRSGLHRADHIAAHRGCNHDLWRRRRFSVDARDSAGMATRRAPWRPVPRSLSVAR
jgi:hypothetical protein